MSPQRGDDPKLNQMMTEKFNLLVVDDEGPQRRTLRTTLTARGFSVEEASTSERAIDLVQNSSFDLILLDINMPGMSGIEACSLIRSLIPLVAIVMLSVRDAESYVVQAFEAGVDDYIRKPFRFAELIARLRAVLRRTAKENAGLTVLHAADLEIDLGKHQVRRSGEAVHLTPREFDLLALLMKNEGTLLTHRKLLRSIWGPEYGAELEYLRSYVRTLRKKLEDNPAQPKYILTEPCVGYRFQNPSDTEVVNARGDEQASSMDSLVCVGVGANTAHTPPVTKHVAHRFGQQDRVGGFRQ